MDSDSVIDTLNSRVSVRKHTGEPLTDELLEKIIHASRRAPTSSNMQAFSYIVVRDLEKRRKLAELVGNQNHVNTSEVFIAVCADIHRLDMACKIHDVKFEKSFEITLTAMVDAAIAGTAFSLAAESFGLGTVMVGGIRNHPLEIAEVLKLPEGVFAVFGMSIGWPSVRPPQKPRFGPGLNVFYEEYGTISEEQLRDYDKKLAEHYRSQGRNTPDDAWSGIIARKVSSRRRAELREQLEKMGFSLD